MQFIEKALAALRSPKGPVKHQNSQDISEAPTETQGHLRWLCLDPQEMPVRGV